LIVCEKEATAEEEGRLSELATSFIIFHRNYLWKHVIERKVERMFEVTGGRGRRHKQLLNDPKEKRRYW